jgi:hypothetical protein
MKKDKWINHDTENKRLSNTDPTPHTVSENTYSENEKLTIPSVLSNIQGKTVIIKQN